jgi:hypothetical protein
VGIKIFLGLVVDIYFELGNFVFGFGYNDEVVGG